MHPERPPRRRIWIDAMRAAASAASRTERQVYVELESAVTPYLLRVSSGRWRSGDRPRPTRASGLRGRKKI